MRTLFVDCLQEKAKEVFATEKTEGHGEDFISVFSVASVARSPKCGNANLAGGCNLTPPTHASKILPQLKGDLNSQIAALGLGISSPQNS
jgi:hypothetical protein